MIASGTTDPDREEMIAVIKAFDRYAETFDIEEAIYWFANDWHAGQASNLYSALSASEFSPSPLAIGPTRESVAELYYSTLLEAFGIPPEDDE